MIPLHPSVGSAPCSLRYRKTELLPPDDVLGVSLSQLTESVRRLLAKRLLCFQLAQLPVIVQRLAHDFVEDLLIGQAMRLRPQVVAQFLDHLDTSIRRLLMNWLPAY